MWIVAQSSIQIESTTKNIINIGDFNFISDREKKLKVFEFTKPKKMLIFYHGHPTFRGSGALIEDKTDLFNELHDEASIKKIARSLKGNFVMGIINENACTIISDRFSVFKFFYHEGPQFIATDSMRFLKDMIQIRSSAENMAKYVLGYHFIGGSTLYSKINHNEPAEIIQYENSKISRFNYWFAKELLSLGKEKVTIQDISSKLKDVVQSNLIEVNPERISLSLTGGADTRNLLAIFLSLDIRPNLYTYGNPKSVDCQKASAIARKLNLKHVVHDIRMTAELFSSVSRRIIRDGNGLASFHRAHRLLATEIESGTNDTMFLGTLGGEFIKGVNEDDYIVPSIVFDNWGNGFLTKDAIIDYLNAKRVNSSELDLNQLRDFINSQPYFIGSEFERKLASLSNITAHLHDAQDVVLYNTVMDSVFTPFLDIDYLELLFSSHFTFENKETHSTKWRRRIENPLYGSNFLNATFKPLLSFEYSGEHRPDEVLRNKYYAAIMKAFRQSIRRRYPPNFPLGEWMRDFVLQELPKCKDFDILDRLFSLDKMIIEVKANPNRGFEGYWLKYTNPIMFSYILKEFGA